MIMGMFTRMNDIVQSNINAMLDKAEDPQKVMRLIIQEMEETLVELRTISARNIAEKKQFTRQIARLEQDVQHWAGKAKLAITHNKETLARAALVQKQQCVEEQHVLEQQLTVISENLAALESDAQRLNAKLTEARAKQKILNTREVSSATRLKAKNMQAQYDIDHAIEKFESYERKIEDLEAQVEAYDVVSSASALEQQFAALEQDDSIEAELAQLKASMQPAAPKDTQHVA
jgi:phage shock protein A